MSQSSNSQLLVKLTRREKKKDDPYRLPHHCLHPDIYDKKSQLESAHFCVDRQGLDCVCVCLLFCLMRMGKCNAMPPSNAPLLLLLGHNVPKICFFQPSSTYFLEYSHLNIIYKFNTE